MPDFDSTPFTDCPRHLQASWRDCAERGEVDGDTPPILRPLIGAIDTPWPLCYFPVYPKRAFKIPIPSCEVNLNQTNPPKKLFP